MLPRQWKVNSVDTRNMYTVLVANTVLKPFVPGIDLATVQGQQEAVDRIGLMRLQAYHSLKKMDYATLKTMDRRSKFYNCPPYRISTISSTCVDDTTQSDTNKEWACDDFRVCPWCWGRLRVRPVWGALQHGAWQLGFLENDRHINHQKAEIMELKWLQAVTVPNDSNPERRLTRFTHEAELSMLAMQMRLDAISTIMKNSSRGYVSLGDIYPTIHDDPCRLMLSVRIWFYPFPGDVGFHSAQAAIRFLSSNRVTGAPHSADHKSLLKLVRPGLRFHVQAFHKPVLTKMCLDLSAKSRLLRTGGVCRTISPIDPED